MIAADPDFGRADSGAALRRSLLSAALIAGNTSAMSPLWFATVVSGIALGSWVAGRRVTELLPADVTHMDRREGFMANLVTASLVASGATLGWPMSTTQVATGAIIGIASTGNEKINWKSVRAILLAWVATLPSAAVLGIASYFVLRSVGIR
jgi:PiT family inorganic phosphate transporter